MDKKFAVFVDGDNICVKDYEPALREIGSTYGTILMKRVYGDWTTPHMNTWKEILIKEPATPCQQFRSGLRNMPAYAGIKYFLRREL